MMIKDEGCQFSSYRATVTIPGSAVFRQSTPGKPEVETCAAATKKPAHRKKSNWMMLEHHHMVPAATLLPSASK